MARRTRGHGGRPGVTYATALLCVPIWVTSCGGTSHDDEPPHGAAAQGSSAAGAGGGGSASGGKGGTSGSGGSMSGTSGTSAGRGSLGGSGGVSGRSGGGRGGGSGAAGAGGAAAGMSAGGSSGTGGGSGGMPVEGAGFICQSPNRCDIGERCVGCTTSGDTKYLCAPNPDEDPAGFAVATQGCDPGVGEHYADCDGPEDCPRGLYCVWGYDPMMSNGGTCVTEAELPEPLTANCCFTCDALPLCVLCNTEDDCPETLLCVENIGAPSAVNGCRVPD